MKLLMTVWSVWLEAPAQVLKAYTGIDWTAGTPLMASKIVLIVLLVLVVLELLAVIHKLFRKIGASPEVLESQTRRATPIRTAPVKQEFARQAAKRKITPTIAVAVAAEGRLEESMEMFWHYFMDAKNADEAARLAAAKQCWRQLAIKGENIQLKPRLKNELLTELAKCFAKAGENYPAGYVWMKIDRFAEAAKLLVQVQAGGKDYQAARILLAHAHYELQNWLACEAILDVDLANAEIDKATIDLWYLLGIAKEFQGKVRDALRIYNHIVTFYPGYLDIRERVAALAPQAPGTGAKVSAAPVKPKKLTGRLAENLKLIDQKLVGPDLDLIKKLGEGGMGVVYLAHDNVMDREVAVKILSSNLAKNIEFRDRFIREAKTGGRISHPNVVQVYTHSVFDEQLIIVMEYLQGKDLDEILIHGGQRVTIDEETAMAIFLPVCRGLQAIHGKNIIHRDIKPANILVTDDRQVKLMDFGIAKSLDSETRMTAPGSLMGTPYYMPPEAHDGKPSDKRSDIYSLGLVMYEAITGKQPLSFLGSAVTLRELCEAKVANFAHPREVNRNVSKKLDRIVMKCIEPDPEKRYQSVDELIADLERPEKKGWF